jgi:HEAT repeat protein
MRMAPCADEQACAKRIDFGTVRNVSGRTITVMAHKVPGPAAHDPISVSLYYLKSSNKHKRSAAIRNLRDTPPDDNRRAAVTSALEGLLDDADFSARADAVRALGVWGTKENVPALLAVLQKDKEFVPRHGAMEALARLKDDRAIEPIAARLAIPADRNAAAKALQDIGPAAEKAVRAQLNDPDNWTKTEACHVLRVIGSRQSLPALQRLINDPDISVRSAAQDTIKVLQAK